MPRGRPPARPGRPRKTAARKTATRKTAARRTAARKTPARRTTARKTATRKTAARRTTARKSAARRTPVARKRRTPEVSAPELLPFPAERPQEEEQPEVGPGKEEVPPEQT